MYFADRHESRQIFFTAWKKYLTKSPISTLEKQIIDIILLHPEYQELLTDPEQFLNEDFIDTNPFLHMSLHLALHDQIKMNRPRGIPELYHTFCQKFSDKHIAEHKMLEGLAKILWEIQREQKPYSDDKYMLLLKQILNEA